MSHVFVHWDDGYVGTLPSSRAVLVRHQTLKMDGHFKYGKKDKNGEYEICRGTVRLLGSKDDCEDAKKQDMKSRRQQHKQ